MMVLTKLDAAMHQLNVAIRLFVEEDYLSSLTLAGAAEGILDGLCRRKGLPTAAEYIAEFHLEDTDSTLPDKARRGVIYAVLNNGRNQAKHANLDGEDEVDVAQVHPLQMLMRAVPMVRNLGAPSSKEIRELYQWITDHPEAFE
ncbi:hypothetical protein [Pandoraea sp. NPDC090278]|uniref:hypothetical protein n=1 Tax=Pandoraea sp. NPDC090278 TaxID=3364391 RepID=UPI003839D014